MFIVLPSTAFCFKATLSYNPVILQEEVTQRILHISDFISSNEAEKILEMPVRLKDSLYKATRFSTRFQFNYRVKATKDTADPAQYRGLFFAYEEYQNIADATELFSSFKKENAKMNTVTDYNKAGDEGFLTLDKSGVPSIFIRKGNKTFKFRLYNLSGNNALKKLEAIVVKIVSAR